ncbi:unnamed protein product [Prunus brigantina]
MTMVNFCVSIAMLILTYLLFLQRLSLLTEFWISGAHIMCSNKEWFDTYEKEEKGEVMMGDGSVCRVKSIGSIKVKMHDGFVRLLGMVRYIPKLSKNLISLGTLDKNGYTFKANRGKLIISKGSLVIIKLKIQPNCLYKLCGTVVTNGAVVSTSKDLEDETQLWHLRLGHMSE